MTKNHETGRSMVEMLGVLAVIGVLSIGGIMGYNYAIAKTKSNSVMNELTLRAMALSASLERTTPTVNTPLTMEMGTVFQMGYATTAKMSVNPEYFEITVQGVDKKICELTLTDYNLSAFTIVNNALYESSTAMCNDAENDMTFVYKKDLGERRTCAAKGFFNIDSYKCECAGGTYFDNTTKDCVCPDGHIWSEKNQKCIKSICEEGYFESVKDGCIPCDSPDTYYEIDLKKKDSCNACQNRTAYYNNCAITCGKNEFYSNDNRCVSCSESTGYHVVYTDQMDACDACPNWMSINKTFCIPTNKCTETEFLKYTNGGSINCQSCSDPALDHKLSDEKMEASCMACKNDFGQTNRQVIDKKCVKILCDSDEFMGADGVCYKCTEKTGIAVNKNSNCTSPTCNRTEIDGICQLSECQSTETTQFIRLADGSCHSCEDKCAFLSTETECKSCGMKNETEYKRGYLESGWCALNIATLEQSYPYVNTNGCYGSEEKNACSEPSVAIDNSDYIQSYCLACGNFIEVDDLGKKYCINPNACNKGSEFRLISAGWGSSRCISCSLSDNFYIGEHDEQIAMCEACSTVKRFYNDKNCYRCDNAQEFNITNDIERASCTKCPNRQINAEGKCVLVVAEG